MAPSVNNTDGADENLVQPRHSTSKNEVPNRSFTSAASRTPPERTTLFQNMLFLEVFPGTSSLSMEVRKTNLRGVAIDKTTERAKGPITILDLILEEDIKFLVFFCARAAQPLPHTFCGQT